MSRMLKALKRIEAEQAYEADTRQAPSEDATITAALTQVEEVASLAADELSDRTDAWPGQPTEGHARAYGKLADAVLDSLTPGLPASLMFVSPTDGGGTTGMLVPLAVALAERMAAHGMPEGLTAMDANLREPALARGFGVEATQGLADVLTGGAMWQEVVRSTSVPGVSVLPGVRFPGPGGRFPEYLNLGPLLRQLGTTSPLVLIDAASLSNPEVPPMVHCCTGVYLVVRLGHTTARAVEQSVEVIGNCGGRVLGSVLLGC